MSIKHVLVVALLALVGASAAVAAPPGTFGPTSLRVAPLNSYCAGLTTPELLQDQPTDLVLENITIRQQIIVEGDHVFQRTTIKGDGTDGAGTRFTITGRFEVDALFVDGDFYVFEPHYQGLGTFELTRQDKTIATGSGSMSLSKSTGMYEVFPTTLTCTKRGKK